MNPHRLKCSRGVPCDSCVRRGKSDICRYAPNADRSKADGSKRPPVADRLRRLEELIATLAEDGPIPVARVQQPTPQTQPPVEEEPVTVQSTMTTPDQTYERPPAATVVSQTGYAEANHWSSILEDIRDIREQLAPGHAEEPVLGGGATTPPRSATPSSGAGGTASSGFDLDFGHTGGLTFREILSGLPSRQVCDFLVAHYFQARFTTLRTSRSHNPQTDQD